MEQKYIAPLKIEPYSRTARRFHWWTVALIAAQVPIGFVMVYRGKILDVWDTITNTLYSSHKLFGMLILTLVLARLTYRLFHGAPAHEPTLARWERTASRLVHGLLYALLLILPLLGWLGVSYYGARDIFGLFSLPALAAENKDSAELAFYLHRLAAFTLLFVLAGHIGAALHHHFIRKNGVLRRMLPERGTG
jgi:cytochrome b561